jgi:hypothetical protein
VTGGKLTVKELREFLDKHEAEWSETDVKFLGKFEDQRILSRSLKMGYTFSKIEEAFGYGGFFVWATDENGEIIQ